MKELKKRWRLLAFVGVGLLVAALLSLSPIAWATPGQQDNGNQTVVGKDGQVCDPLEADDVVFTFTFLNGGEQWTNVVFTDDIYPPPLTVKKVTVECEQAGMPVSCPTYTPDPVPPVSNVTFTMAVLPADTKVTVTIECSCSEHTYITNTGTVYALELEEAIDATWSGYVDPCEEEFVPEMGSLLLLGSGLAGLAGYAGVRRRARRG